jgi:hypothetical protein
LLLFFASFSFLEKSGKGKKGKVIFSKMENKKILGSLVLITILVLSLSLVNAEFWACFNKGEQINYCNPKVPDRTCSSSMGCEYCMSTYDASRSCYNQGNWQVCNGIVKDCTTGIGGNHTIDGTPPEFTLNSPEKDGVYTSRSTLLDFDLDEKASVYFYDNLNGRARWTRVCSGCYPGSPAYSRRRSFKEGFNNLTFRAVDVVGNEVLIERTFFVDSKKPQIHRSQPRRGFASGLFEIQYTELNLEYISLTYGNLLTGMQTINLTSCISGKRQWCSTDVDLGIYDGQQIEYSFMIGDIAGNVKQYPFKKLDVDVTSPKLNNIPFHNYTEGERYVRFTFNVTEENFDEIVYFDHLERRPRWRRLCSRLRDGICEKRKSFRRGTHVLDIEVIDDAGNAIAERINFTISY